MSYESLILRADALRAIEVAARPAPLMERAGHAAAEIARTMLAGRPPGVVVLAGPGNNGGDGFVVARWLRQWFFDVSVAFAGDPSRLPDDAKSALAAWHAGGGGIADRLPTGRVGLVVDAVFGIGLKRAAGGTYGAWIEWANRRDAPILALDVPSGLDGDTGVALEPVIRAAHTTTFIALKPGLLTGDGPDVVGEVSVHGLDLDVGALAPDHGTVVSWETARAAIRPRRRNTHKGTYGSLGIIGGSEGMMGAALLAGRAALMTGAGKVHLGWPSRQGPGVDWLQPELMMRSADKLLAMPLDALVVGPGLGTAGKLPWLGSALRTSTPLVADADLLNRIAGEAGLADALSTRAAPTLMTPHPAEAARLLGASTAEIQQDRVTAAVAVARKFSAFVVLKGCGSVCAAPDGRWFINTTGNPGLASGGTGDTLAGMLGALLAQGLSPLDALLAAVSLHGAAADALTTEGAGPAGTTASELPPVARRLLNAATATG